MTERVFEVVSKVSADGKVRISAVIYDHHLTGESTDADVQISITACISGVQPSFTFYEKDPVNLFLIAEQFKKAAVALQYAKKFEAKQAGE